MTLDECAYELRISPKTLLRNFNRTHDNFKKKGVILTKWGRGKKTEYHIEYMDKEEFDEFKGEDI